MAFFESKRRRKLARLMNQYRALLILSKSSARADRIHLDEIIESVPTLTSKQLIRAEAFYIEHLAEMAKRVRLIARPDALVAALRGAPTPVAEHSVRAKIHIETKWFRNFAEGRFPAWPLFPPHARIGIDLEADPDDHHMRLDWRMLEASLFEDIDAGREREDDANMHELLTVEEVAALLKVSKSWVYEHTRSRVTPRSERLPYVKVGKYVRFETRALRAFVPISPNNVLRRWVFPACAELGLPNASWLTFRRTYASWAHEKGVPGKVLAELMGHAKVDTSLNVYTQVIDGAKRVAAQQVGGELFTIVHDAEGARMLTH